jgi:flagellar motor protein MotB
MASSKSSNPWIPIADLLAGFVFIMLLMFVTASLRLTWLEEREAEAERAQLEAVEQRKRSTFAGVAGRLANFEAAGIVRVDRKNSTVALTDLSFRSGSACLSPEAIGAVHAVANGLKDLGESDRTMLTLFIEGHTDPRPVPRLANACGWFEDNIQLSTLRAANVREEVLSAAGQGLAGSLAVAGYGSSRLANTDEPTAPENRRVELRFVWPQAGGQ